MIFKPSNCSMSCVQLDYWLTFNMVYSFMSCYHSLSFFCQTSIYCRHLRTCPVLICNCSLLTVQINEAQTTYLHAVGAASEVGTYAGGFFVRPNTIDFVKSMKMFLKPWENPIGIILVSVIFGLFFLLLYWALRADKKDKLLVCI